MSNEFSNNEIYEDSIEDNNIVKHSISYTNSFQFSRENRITENNLVFKFQNFYL